MASLYISGPLTHTGNRHLSPVSWAGVVLNSGVVGPSLVLVGLGGGREWPVEKPNPGGRKKTLRDTTRTAEISEST
jgi:hypothetical protein